ATSNANSIASSRDTRAFPSHSLLNGATAGGSTFLLSLPACAALWTSNGAASASRSRRFTTPGCMARSSFDPGSLDGTQAHCARGGRRRRFPRADQLHDRCRHHEDDRPAPVLAKIEQDESPKGCREYGPKAKSLRSASIGRFPPAKREK